MFGWKECCSLAGGEGPRNSRTPMRTVSMTFLGVLILVPGLPASGQGRRVCSIAERAFRRISRHRTR